MKNTEVWSLRLKFLRLSYDSQVVIDFKPVSTIIFRTGDVLETWSRCHFIFWNYIKRANFIIKLVERKNISYHIFVLYVCNIHNNITINKETYNITYYFLIIVTMPCATGIDSAMVGRMNLLFSFFFSFREYCSVDISVILHDNFDI